MMRINTKDLRKFGLISRGRTLLEELKQEQEESKMA
jgi:hypothetical protein